MATATKPLFGLALLLFLAACGGGGGGGSTVAPGSTPTPLPSVSGDMLGYQTSRGWNYSGSDPSIAASTVTATIYADPQQSTAGGLVDPLVLFAQAGTAVNALAGQKIAGLGVLSSGSGYTAIAYILLSSSNTVYASGAISPAALLVPNTLTLNQTYTPYPGATATVTFVGSVPFANSCPVPANGATVQYQFMGKTYSVSYVPGCGITQFTDPSGANFGLASVALYPQEGNQSVGRKPLSQLNLLDTLQGAIGAISGHIGWHPLIGR